MTFFFLPKRLLSRVAVLALLSACLKAPAARAQQQDWPPVTTQPLSTPYEVDRFGVHAATDGETLVVTSRHAAVDSYGVSNAGAGYLFERNNDGSSRWDLSGNFSETPPISDMRFGTFVCVQGDTMVVGPTQNFTAFQIYRKDATTGEWIEENEHVVGGYTETGAISEDGTTLVVGVGNINTVLVYEKDESVVGSPWRRRQSIVSTVGSFGTSVDVYGDFLVVGAPWSGPPRGSGTALLYQRNHTTNHEFGFYRDLSDHTVGFDRYGHGVALHGDTVVVGGPGFNRPESDGGPRKGYVCVFRSTDDYSTCNRIEGASPAGVEDSFGYDFQDSFGYDLDVYGNRIGVVSREEMSVYFYRADDLTFLGRMDYHTLPSEVFLFESEALVGVPSEGRTFVYNFDISAQAPPSAASGSSQAPSPAPVSASQAPSAEPQVVDESAPAPVQEVTGGGVPRFGHGCAITDDTLAVTSNIATINGLSNAGAMFLYDKYGYNQELELQGNFTDPTLARNGNFASGGVAVDGNIMVAGPCEHKQSFCIYGRTQHSGSAWTLLQIARIGYEVSSVAIRGTTIAVGSVPPVAGRRRVIVYDLRGDDWTETQTITSGLPGFGSSVKISGNVMAVGAPYRFLVPEWSSAGAVRVYSYNHNDVEWDFEQELRPTALDDNIRFGYSLSLADNGNLIVVGAPQFLATPAKHGYVSIWERASPSSDWAEMTTLTGEGMNDDGDRFGWSVATDGTRILVSDFSENVFVYAIEQGNFTLEDKLEYPTDASQVAIFNGQACVAVPAARSTYVIRFFNSELLPSSSSSPPPAPSPPGEVFPPPSLNVSMSDVQRFGHKCYVTNDTLAVTSNWARVDDLMDAGSMFLYDKNDTNQELALRGSFTDRSPTSFGHYGQGGVAVEGNTMVMGPCNSKQSFCIYDRAQAGDTWNLRQVEDIGVEVNSVAMHNGTIAVGSLASDTRRVIVYSRSDETGGGWTERQLITSSVPGFGWSVKVLNDTMVVGAPFRFGSSGSVFVYTYNSTAAQWAEAQVLLPAVLEDNIRFGYSLGLANHGNLIVIGVPYFLHASSPRHGYVSVWERLGGASNWDETTTLEGEGANQRGDRYGWSVDTDGNRILVSDFDRNVFVYLVTNDDDGSPRFPLQGKLEYPGDPSEVAISEGHACVAIPGTRTTYVLRFPYESVPPPTAEPPSLAPTETVNADDDDAISFVTFDAGTDELTIGQAGVNFTTIIDVTDGDSDPTNELITAMDFDRNTGTLTITEGGGTSGISGGTSSISTVLDVNVNDDDADPTNELITNMDYDINTGILTITEAGTNYTATIGMDESGTRRNLASDGTDEMVDETENKAYEAFIPRVVLSAAVPVLKVTNGKVDVTYGMDGAVNGYGMVIPGTLLGFSISLDEPFASNSYVDTFVTINNDVVIRESATLEPSDLTKSVRFVDPVHVQEEDVVRFSIDIRGDKLRPRNIGADLALLLEQ